MAPSVDVKEAADPSSATVKAENQKSMKVLEDLLSKLTVSKAQDEINATSQELATFINGDIQEADAPIKYVCHIRDDAIRYFVIEFWKLRC